MTEVTDLPTNTLAEAQPQQEQDVQTPEIKRSRNPFIQENVDAITRILRKKFPTATPEHLNSQARDRVAHQLDRARLRKEIQQNHSASITDELTGFLNSAGFNEMLVEDGVLAARTGEAGAIVTLDADGLKALNDTMGHKAGDEYLKKIAKILDETTRSSDTKAFEQADQAEEQTRVARWGGDEYGVVLGKTDLNGALSWWTRASKRFRDEGVSIGAGLQMIDPQELKGKSRAEIKEIMARLKSEADLAMMMIAKPQSRDQREPVLAAYGNIPPEQIPTLTQQAEQIKSAKQSPDQEPTQDIEGQGQA